MEQKKILKILATMFAMRSKYYEENEMYSAAIAYRDAFDMLAYAVNGNWDCLSQFGWSDEAEDLINKVGVDVDFGIWKI